jgi:hypothetical protein
MVDALALAIRPCHSSHINPVSGAIMDASELTTGQTYYRLTFADRDLTMPGVQPLVYIGEVELSEGGRALAFQDTVSYVRFGSRLDATEGIDNMEVHLISFDALTSDVLTIAQVAREVAAAADRAVCLGTPALAVIRDGWQSMP